MRVNIDAALLMIDVACENRHMLRKDESRKLLLVGIYELTDFCLEAIQAVGNPAKWTNCRTEIELVRDLAVEGLKSDNLEKAFNHIQGVSLRAVPSPEEI
jgi:hypothetical protein